MKKFILLFMFAGLLIVSNSCKENTIIDPGNDQTQNDLTVDPVVQDQATAGFQVNGYVQSSQEIEDVTATSGDNAINSGPSFGQSIVKMAIKTVSALRAAQNKADYSRTLAKVSGEVTLFYQDTVDAHGNKTRSALLFDPLAGQFRFYIVIYDFAPRHVGDRTVEAKLTYDSTDVIQKGTSLDSLDNFTPSNIYNLQKFKDGFIVAQTETQIEITGWSANNEPLDFTATSISTYAPDANITKVTSAFTGHADGSGVITRTIEFSDGTSTTTTYTFGNDNSGTFTRTSRNGVNVSGSFNRVFDDGKGFYNATITFPAGSYIKTIVKNATVTYDSVNYNFNADYHEVITFAADSVDSAHVVIAKDLLNGITTMTVTRRNGAHGSFQFQETDNVNVMTGYWITHKGFYVDVRAEYYADGSSYVHYKVYTDEAAFNNGDDPIVDAEYNFGADQSGNGTVTYKGKKYEVTLGANGEGSILLGGKQRTVRLY